MQAQLGITILVELDLELHARRSDRQCLASADSGQSKGIFHEKPFLQHFIQGRTGNSGSVAGGFMRDHGAGRIEGIEGAGGARAIPGCGATIIARRTATKGKVARNLVQGEAARHATIYVATLATRQ